ncbi:MAG: 30S ribosomal protein S8 [Gammaproteobacteria bacterium]|jgi:small subunit ribosomal protein S8|nr:30S ribosomal protein S8 [Gammaproteobacteria bacterium]MBT7603560.1 30S ribosomal protein S8 [Gammaproteobacteria bacterium]
MSMSDPISAMITIIRNGQMVNKSYVCTDMSNTKESILKVLKDEGYINDYEVKEMENNKKRLKIKLKYFQGKPVISNIKRISKPSLRIYKSKNKLPKVLGGLGVAIVSTSKGVMTADTAKNQNCGGEIICTVE